MQKETEARIFTAAVVDQKFCRGILGSDRVKTIKNGYQGEEFKLSLEDEQMLSSMGDFKKLSEFAKRLIEFTQESNC